jgi:integrase/recombinase XerD
MMALKAAPIMQGKSEGLYLYTRHSGDCKHHPSQFDRNESRRCNCVRYIGGTAADGTILRQSTGTSSWEKARKALARASEKHDPMNRSLLASLIGDDAKIAATQKTIKDAVSDYMESKHGTNRRYETIKQEVTLLERQFLDWCAQQGIVYLAELNLENITKFRNSWGNTGTTTNRKASRLRGFFRYCQRRKWIIDNPAELLEPSKEDPTPTDHFSPDEYQKILDATYVSHEWQGGRDFKHRSDRVRAVLLFMRWTGLAVIDVVRFEKWRMTRDNDGVWMVKLHRTKTNQWVQVAIPAEVAEAVLAIPAMSDSYFFWSGNGDSQTACKGWRRCLTKVFKAAKLKRNGKSLRCHLHMLRDTFAVEKLEAGATMEEVSELLGHEDLRVTQKHYMPWDRRTQERLKRASMVDWHQIQKPKPAPKEKQRPKLVVMSQAAGN